MSHMTWTLLSPGKSNRQSSSPRTLYVRFRVPVNQAVRTGWLKARVNRTR